MTQKLFISLKGLRFGTTEWREFAEKIGKNVQETQEKYYPRKLFRIENPAQFAVTNSCCLARDQGFVPAENERLVFLEFGAEEIGRNNQPKALVSVMTHDMTPPAIHKLL